MDPKSIANSLLQFYYANFNGNRNALEVMYKDNSTLYLNGNTFTGPKAIIGGINSLPPCQATPLTYDCQSNHTNGALILINGDLKSGSGQTVKFCEMFNIQPNPAAQGQYYVLNHAFSVQQ